MFDFTYLNQFTNNDAVAWCTDTSTIQVYKYKEVLSESKKVIHIITQNIPSVQENIAICCDHLPSLLSIIISILNKSHSVHCVNFQTQTNEIVGESRFNYVFTTTADCRLNNGKLIEPLTLFENIQIYLWKLDNRVPGNNESYIEDLFSPNRICYCVSTSGSTGEPKFIRVPYKSIVPNITHLSDKLKITSADTLLVSSPPTFDVFFVDIFLALKNGSCIFGTSANIKLSRLQLADILFPAKKSVPRKSVTFMQMTPSLFTQWPVQIIRDRVFSTQSSFRTLVLGGEEFPQTAQIAKWQNWNDPNAKKVYNIYGISEISCWATIQEITAETLNDSTVPLGKAIDDETILEVRNPVGEISTAGELFIGSKSRICFINDENRSSQTNNIDIIFRGTGDFVEERNGNLYYLARTNNIVKHYGIRTDLNKIEKIMQKSFATITKICCIFNNVANELILFYSSEKEIDITEFRNVSKSRLEVHERPSYHIHIREFPLSKHGKISRHQLLENYKENYSLLNETENDSQNIVEIFEEELFKISGINPNLESGEINPKRLKPDWQQSFKELGGTSIKALEILTLLETKFGRSLPELFIILLDDTKVVKYAIEYLVKIPNTSEGSEDTLSVDSGKITTTIRFKYNLLKCIDSSPTIRDGIVSVGSHSHLLVNLDVATGELISQLKLPDRIECEMVILENGTAVVGCYDGYLYNFDIKTGRILWKFDSNGMIKARPLVLCNKSILFGNYCGDKNLWCVDESGLKIWSQLIGTKGILAAPLILTNDSILICTLDGTCAVITKNGQVNWTNKFDTPFFSSPQIIPNTKLALVVEVSGKVHAIDFAGNKISTFTADGNIFSSLAITERKEILFGCYDHQLYCIHFDDASQKLNLKWKIKLQSQIYATPLLLNSNKLNRIVLACCTSGELNFIDCDNVAVLNSFKLPGEVYSSPKHSNNNHIFIGCRDNFLYCLEYILRE